MRRVPAPNAKDAAGRPHGGTFKFRLRCAVTRIAEKWSPPARNLKVTSRIQNSAYRPPRPNSHAGASLKPKVRAGAILRLGKTTKSSHREGTKNAKEFKAHTHRPLGCASLETQRTQSEIQNKLELYLLRALRASRSLLRPGGESCISSRPSRLVKNAFLFVKIFCLTHPTC
jgi:hypothetical protein